MSISLLCGLQKSSEVAQNLSHFRTNFELFQDFYAQILLFRKSFVPVIIFSAKGTSLVEPLHAPLKLNTPPFRTVPLITRKRNPSQIVRHDPQCAGSEIAVCRHRVAPGVMAINGDNETPVQSQSERDKTVAGNEGSRQRSCRGQRPVELCQQPLDGCPLASRGLRKIGLH